MRDEPALLAAFDGLRFDQCAKVIGYWRQRADEQLGSEEPPPEAAPSSL